MAILEARTKFESIFRHSPIGIGISRQQDGSIIDVNEAWLSIYGRTREEVVGQTALQLGIYETPADRQHILDILARDGSVRNFEKKTRKTNGDLLEIEVCVEPIEIQGKKYLLIINHDITERKQADERQRTAALEIEKLYNHAPCGYHSLDQDGKIVRINDTELALLGYRREELLGRKYSDLFTAAGVEIFKKHFIGFTGKDRLINLKMELIRKDGSILPVIINSVADRDEQGQFRCTRTTLFDNTEHLKAEETLRRAVQATAAANRTKTEFLATMSHEIRTPMNAIMGYTQLLQHNPSLSDTARKQAEIIHRSGENLLSLVNSILEVSKIEVGRVTVQPVGFDSQALLEDLIRLFSERAANKGLTLKFHKEAGLPRYLEADQGKIRQVLSNLLSNAIKFTELGGVQLSASMVRLDAGQMRLVVQIEDTGAGIAPEEIPHLFERFVQTTSGRQTTTGSGLGLFISRQYARIMGGDITVASQPEKGSVFQFEVPVKVTNNTVFRKKSAGAKLLRISSQTGSKRVFVVDDMPMNREMLSHMLEEAGFEVSTFSGGEEALAAFEASRPDLILMDTMMPEMDGLETIRRLRAKPEGATPKIITVSASAFVEDREAAKQAGANDFLAKPFNIQDLLEKIGRLLDIKYANLPPPSEAAVKTADAEWRHRPLKPEHIAKLPVSLRQQMHEALVIADFVAVHKLIAQVAPLDSQLASSLTHLADRFDAEQMLQLLESATLPTAN